MQNNKFIWIKDRVRTHIIPTNSISGVTIDCGWGSLQNRTEHRIDIYHPNAYKDAGMGVTHLVFFEHTDVINIFQLLKDISLQQTIEIPSHLKDVMGYTVLVDNNVRYEDRLFFTPTKFINLKKDNNVHQLPIETAKNIKCERVVSFNPPHAITETRLTYQTPSDIPNHLTTHRVSLNSDVDMKELILTLSSYTKEPFLHIPESLKNTIELSRVCGSCIINKVGSITITDQYGHACALELTVDDLNGVRVCGNNLILYKNYGRAIYVPFVHNSDLIQCVTFLANVMKKRSSSIWVMNETHVAFNVDGPNIALSNIKDMSFSADSPTLLVTCEHGIIPVPWDKPEYEILTAFSHWKTCNR